MNDMASIALTYTFLAWLAGWWIDLLVTVARGPVLIDPILKLIVVTVCLVVIVVMLWKHHWLFA